MKLTFITYFVTFSQCCQAWISPITTIKGPYARPNFTSLKASTSRNEFNVVLRPSENPESFDSQKIGAARVHRYARDSNDSEAEYIMWYHGRSLDFDGESKLPPLSTGRIGRAISRNGLHWEKEEIGSASEDIGGVSLGLNKESWWGFDTAHVGLGQVLLPMSTPAVMTDGGVYLMYYMGGNFEETSVSQYLEGEVKGAENMNIQGMNMKIGVALSQDGVSFGRVEGDDPSGAIMAPYDKSDPNMKYMAAMRDDDGSRLNLEEELYCAWPEVAVNDVAVDERGTGSPLKNFYMFYSTMLKATKEKVIGVAVSDDGFRWFKRGISLKPDADGMDNGGCARCSVIRKAIYTDDGTWENDKGWYMFYEGVSLEDGKHRIMAAESDDLRKWKKLGVILDVGEDGSWDFGGVGSPHLLRLDDGSTRMYYTGQCADGRTAIGVAVSRDNILNWVREQATLPSTV
mmetsp:Transcript_12177/g.22815  ORF Transcript_12177/g.22815 Transcript_12177/m.22815 type:complete len:458 (-) Transcript_12177:85-1458(-)